MTTLRLPRAWLTRAPARTFFVALAVGSSLAVVLLLEGVQSGIYAQMERVVLNRGADLIVAQAHRAVTWRGCVASCCYEKTSRSRTAIPIATPP